MLSLKRIAGRQRNVFVLPDGRRWWPAFASVKIKQFLDFRQFQLAQTGERTIELRFVSDDPHPIKNALALQAYLKDIIPGPMEFTLRQVKDIPRAVSGKFEDSVCEISI